MNGLGCIRRYHIFTEQIAGSVGRLSQNVAASLLHRTANRMIQISTSYHQPQVAEAEVGLPANTVLSEKSTSGES